MRYSLKRPLSHPRRSTHRTPRLQRRPLRARWDLIEWAAQLESLRPTQPISRYLALLHQSALILETIGLVTLDDQLMWIAQWPLPPGVFDRLQFTARHKLLAS